MKRIVGLILVVLFSLVSLSLFAAGESDAESSEIGKVITYSVMASGSYDKAAEEIAEVYYNKTGTKVEIAAFPWATLRQNNTTDLLTGAGQYDVMSGSYYLADLYEHFIPLDDYIAKYNFGDGLLTGFMEKCEVYNGSQIGLPYGPDAYGMIYRSDLFDAAGLEWPSTWTEFIALMPELKKLSDANGIDPLVFAGGAPEQAVGLFLDKYDGFYINAAGEYELQVNKAVSALKQNQMINDTLMADDFMGLSIDDANARFLDGGALIVIGWPSFITAACQDPEKSKVVDMWKLGEAFTPGRPWLSLWQMYISKYSENPEEAFLWCMEMISEKNDLALLKEYGIGPVFQSTYDNKEMVKLNQNYLEAQAVNLSVAFNPPMSGEAQDYFSSVLGEFHLGQLTPEEVVDKVNAKWKSISVPSALNEAAMVTGQAAK